MKAVKGWPLVMLLLAFAAWPIPAPACGMGDGSASAFVTRFYERYLDAARADPSAMPWVARLMDDGDCFGEALGQALRADVRAQAGASGEIVGIDFDPFLASQDPEGYRLGSVQCTEERCRVELSMDSGGRKSAIDPVFILVDKRDGQWRIVDVEYSDRSRLLQVLTALARVRAGAGGS